ncbi:transcriptional regulator [Verrucomicrobia bacterium]|nr:transcriptional regulator [Verrucomicrobiota bacterium]MDG1893186.1 transcriptional regulator [Verrucomicrobiota bacterium]
MKTETFNQLNKVIHEKGRMAIMTILASNPEMSFKELKESLGMTDGNLSVHIRTLQQAGFVVISKTFVRNRPHTSYRLTSEGVHAFGTYIDVLEEIVRMGRGVA